jgi:tetratricopeptide (TPR) repeat protein
MDSKSIQFEADMVSEEEKFEIEPENDEESILSRAGRLIYFGFIVLLPIWFLPITTAPIDLNKAFLAGVMLIGALMLSIGGMLQEGRIRFLKSRFFSVSLLLLFVWLLSSIFSLSPAISLWGYGSETTTFLSLIMAVVALFTTTVVLHRQEHLKKMLVFLSVGISLTLILFFIRSVLNISIFDSGITSLRSFNTFGSWNALALFFGFGVSILIPIIGQKMGIFSKLIPVLFILLILASLLMNFAVVWILIGAISLLFVALALSLREQKGKLFAVSLVLLLISTLFLLLGGALGGYFNNSFSGFGRPNEVRPSMSTTFDLAKQVLEVSPVLGSGPNTFGLKWDELKDPSVNASSVFAQVRFSSGHNTILTTLMEGGILSTLVLLSLMIMLAVQGIRVLGASSGEKGMFVRSAFSGCVFLFLSWFFYPINFALVLMSFIMAGLFYSALREANLVRSREINFFETKERGFVFSLLLIFLLVGGVAALYYETTRYMGQISYAKGLNIFSEEGAANGALEEINRAIQFDPRQDRYHRTVAQLEYVKMGRALDSFRRGSITQDEMLTNFSTAYSVARANAERAIDIGPFDARNYRSLGQVYERAIPFDANVAELAIANFEKAAELSPADPLIYVDIARTYLALADITILQGGGTTSRAIASEHQATAISFLNNAIALRPNLTQAHFTLSQLYAGRDQTTEAIARAQSTVALVPNDIGALFQLGFLYYQQESYSEARTVFERAVTVQPDYSNARYFLGLIYDLQGLTTNAIEQFRHISNLNPGNEEVEAIIAALESGGHAVDVLGQPPPEERRDTPFTDGRPPQDIQLP